MRFYPLAKLSTLLLGAFLSQSVEAFDKGQRVWIDLPAVNINDDSYAEGQIIQDAGSSKLEIFVKSVTISQAFSSGISCAPNSSSDNWEHAIGSKLTTNETRQIPREQVMNWTSGYNRYFERQNWLNIFLKWSDNHPVIERDQILVMSNMVRARNMNDLAQITDVVLENYDAYQTEHFIFYPLPQRIIRLTPMLQHIRKLLDSDPKLLAAWQPKHRSLEALNQSSYTLFMTQAIDKIVSDAHQTEGLLSTLTPDANTLAFHTALNSLPRKP
jgi:hypothetical protein